MTHILWVKPLNVAQHKKHGTDEFTLEYGMHDANTVVLIGRIQLNRKKTKKDRKGFYLPVFF